MSIRISLAALCASTLILAGACDPTACTDIGCYESLTVIIEGPDGAALPDSTYEIVLELDGSTYVTACGQPSPGEYFCEPVEGVGPHELAAQYTTSGIISLEVIDDTPDEVSLSVIAGDAPLLDESWSVEYETSTPNGQDCGPVCRSADPLRAVIEIEG